MDIDISLFEGSLVRLASINHEGDAEIEAAWTQAPDYLLMMSDQPARPRSPNEILKLYEAIEKEQEKEKNLYYFTIRLVTDDRLLGSARLEWIDWTNGNAFVKLAIGNPNDRNRGFGSETLQLLLRYAFSELNLYRISARLPEYNPDGLRFFAKFGFIEEVRRRGALNRAGKRWDDVHLGLLREEWSALPAGSYSINAERGG